MVDTGLSFLDGWRIEPLHAQPPAAGVHDVAGGVFGDRNRGCLCERLAAPVSMQQHASGGEPVAGEEPHGTEKPERKLLGAVGSAQPLDLTVDAVLQGFLGWRWYAFATLPALPLLDQRAITVAPSIQSPAQVVRESLHLIEAHRFCDCGPCRI